MNFLKKMFTKVKNFFATILFKVERETRRIGEKIIGLFSG
jgi:hypothetical protein